MIPKEEVYAKVEKALNRKSWVAEDWEPYVKCSPEEKEDFVLFLNLMAAFCPKSLGAIDVRFEKCSPYRSFQMFEPLLGDNCDFLDTLITLAIGPEKENA